MHSAGSSCPQPHKGQSGSLPLPPLPKMEAPPATSPFCFLLPAQPWTSFPSAHHHHHLPLMTPAGLWHLHPTVISLLAFPVKPLLPEDIAPQQPSRGRLPIPHSPESGGHPLLYPRSPSLRGQRPCLWAGPTFHLPTPCCISEWLHPTLLSSWGPSASLWTPTNPQASWSLDFLVSSDP